MAPHSAPSPATLLAWLSLLLLGASSVLALKGGEVDIFSVIASHQCDHLEDVLDTFDADELNEPSRRAHAMGNTPLAWALQMGAAKCVAPLLAAGADPCALGGEWTALQWAVALGQRDALAALVGSMLAGEGKSVDCPGVGGGTALMRAAALGNEDAIVSLLSAASKVEIVDDDGLNALMHASAAGQESAVTQLISAAGEHVTQLVSAESKSGVTALTLAAAGGHAEIAKRLLRAHPPGGRGFASALIAATGSGSVRTVDAIFEAARGDGGVASGEFAPWMEECVTLAASKDDLPMVERLLGSASLKGSKTMQTALAVASNAYSMRVLEWLLEADKNLVFTCDDEALPPIIPASRRVAALDVDVPGLNGANSPAHAVLHKIQTTARVGLDEADVLSAADACTLATAACQNGKRCELGTIIARSNVSAPMLRAAPGGADLIASITNPPKETPPVSSNGLDAGVWEAMLVAAAAGKVHIPDWSKSLAREALRDGSVLKVALGRALEGNSIEPSERQALLLLIGDAAGDRALWTAPDDSRLLRDLFEAAPGAFGALVEGISASAEGESWRAVDAWDADTVGVWAFSRVAAMEKAVLTGRETAECVARAMLGAEVDGLTLRALAAHEPSGVEPSTGEVPWHALWLRPGGLLAKPEVVVAWAALQGLSAPAECVLDSDGGALALVVASLPMEDVSHYALPTSFGSSATSSTAAVGTLAEFVASQSADVPGDGGSSNAAVHRDYSRVRDLMKRHLDMKLGDTVTQWTVPELAAWLSLSPQPVALLGKAAASDDVDGSTLLEILDAQEPAALTQPALRAALETLTSYERTDDGHAALTTALANALARPAPALLHALMLRAAPCPTARRCLAAAAMLDLQEGKGADAPLLLLTALRAHPSDALAGVRAAAERDIDGALGSVRMTDWTAKDVAAWLELSGYSELAALRPDGVAVHSWFERAGGRIGRLKGLAGCPAAWCFPCLGAFRWALLGASQAPALAVARSVISRCWEPARTGDWCGDDSLPFRANALDATTPWELAEAAKVEDVLPEALFASAGEHLVNVRGGVRKWSLCDLALALSLAQEPGLAAATRQAGWNASALLDLLTDTARLMQAGPFVDGQLPEGLAAIADGGEYDPDSFRVGLHQLQMSSDWCDAYTAASVRRGSRSHAMHAVRSCGVNLAALLAPADDGAAAAGADGKAKLLLEALLETLGHAEEAGEVHKAGLAQLSFTPQKQWSLAHVVVFLVCAPPGNDQLSTSSAAQERSMMAAAARADGITGSTFAEILDAIAVESALSSGGTYNEQDLLSMKTWARASPDDAQYQQLDWAVKHEHVATIAALARRCSPALARARRAKSELGSTILIGVAELGTEDVAATAAACVREGLDEGARERWSPLDVSNWVVSSAAGDPLAPNLGRAMLKARVAGRDLEELLPRGATSAGGAATLAALAVDSNGKTGTRLIRALLDLGLVTARQKDSHGATLLHRAARIDHDEAVGEILLKGAEVDAADNDGRTALHVAASNGAKNTCQALLEAGASADALDSRGMKPADHVGDDQNLKSMLRGAQRKP